MTLTYAECFWLGAMLGAFAVTLAVATLNYLNGGRK